MAHNPKSKNQPANVAEGPADIAEAPAPASNENTAPGPSGAPGAGSSAAPAANPSPADIIGGNLSFIRRIIESTLVNQPPTVQAVVLFLFIFLFAYMLVMTTQGYVVLSTDVEVELSSEQVQKLKVERKIPQNQTVAFGKPDPGYQIRYGEHYYGLNAEGGVRIAIPMPSYFWALATRGIDVTMKTPDNYGFSQTIRLSGLGLQRIFFDVARPTSGGAESSGQGGAGPGGSLPGGSGPRSSIFGHPFISSAEARPLAGGRLYLQSITVPSSAGSGSVNATLVIGRENRPTLSVGNDAGAAAEGSIAVKSGASVVLNYQTFFLVNETRLPQGSRIRLQAPGIFSGYDETFPLPGELSLGEPLQLQGSAGGTLIVQLAYPIDVVFFERRDTPAITEALVPQVAEIGFAPRVHTGAARTAGSYNVIYAGRDVPFRQLQQVVDLAVQGGIVLKSVQPDLQLSVGGQRQIQIGSSRRVSCLEPIDRNILQRLVRAASESEFRQIADALPPAVCG